MFVKIAFASLVFGLVATAPTHAANFKWPWTPTAGNTINQQPNPNPNNTSIVSQGSGTNMHATTWQSGFGNFALVGQSGGNSSTTVVQSGTGNVSVVNQSGGNNHSFGFQSGSGNVSVVNQVSSP